VFAQSGKVTEKKKLKLYPSAVILQACGDRPTMLVHWCAAWFTALRLLTTVKAQQNCDQLKVFHLDVLTMQDVAELAAAAACSGNTLTATWYGAKILSETITVGSNTSLTITAASGNIFNAAAIDGNSTTQLFIVYGNLMITNMTLLNGFSSTQGGAITVVPSAFAALKCCTLTGHRAAEGAAVFIDRGTLQIKDSTFSSNAAEQVGSSIYASGAVVNIMSSVFMNESNSAVYATDGETVTVINSTFSNNLATQGSGLTCQNSTTAYVSECLFDSNQATVSGGAITILIQSQLIASNTLFNSNTAKSGSGGAVVTFAASSAEFTNVSILSTDTALL
jgi:hypothetical protein